ncbi:hypothetical protein [Aquisalimonas asiatica]|uniref:Phytol kinase n=1 Tax=Aquisalimonas asiatica TaxID=406100 RepID=A0A1H8Q1D4_9GAMM|nr:hypothetical protein [Aquisalimonas asiatica]SEO48045.1 phytol kinase [Aquisalimonas asiatica]
MDPWLAITGVLAALTALGLGLWLCQRRFALHPELVRKLFHVGAGGICMTLPWVFTEAWPVLTLTGAALAGLVGVRILAAYGQGPGSILHDISRRSVGEIAFPVAVAVLFLLTADTPLLYVIPLLVLTLADAAAALAGLRYGTVRYTTSEGRKSLEGSAAFFLVTFLSVHVPLLLFSDVGRPESLLLGLVLALLVMLLEAIAWRGMDNIYIPLGCYLLLTTHWHADTGQLAGLLAVTAGLLAFAWWWRTRTTLHDSATLATALIGYLLWAVGGWIWLVPPLVVFITYVLLSRRLNGDGDHVHGLRALLSVTIPGGLWLLFALHLQRPELYAPYTAAFAAQLAIIGVARFRYQFPRTSNWRTWVTAALRAWALVYVPFAAMAASGATGAVTSHALLLQVAAGGAATALAALLFSRLQPGLDDCPVDNARWLRQGTIAAAVSPIALIGS